MLGAKVKVIFEDSQAKPDTAVTKAKKLILEDHVQMFLGGVLASEGYALAPVSTAEKTVYISPVAAADDLTQRQLGNYPYFIRTGWSSSQPNHPYGQWACDQGYKKSPAGQHRRLRLRLRAGRRFPEGFRGLRRQDHPEDLAADRHQGFRALYPDHQGRCRRGIFDDGRADGAAIPQAVAAVRLHQAGRRRRHQL